VVLVNFGKDGQCTGVFQSQFDAGMDETTICTENHPLSLNVAPEMITCNLTCARFGVIDGLIAFLTMQTRGKNHSVLPASFDVKMPVSSLFQLLIQVKAPVITS
jgi:hypothetical protein